MYAWRRSAAVLPGGSARGLGATSSAAAAIQDLIRQAAARFGVPASIALSVGYQESRYNQSAISPKGAIGVMQLMPGTASDLRVNPYDVGENIDGGVSYLARLYQQFGDWTTALQAYNGGPGNVSRGTVSSAARSYADQVLGRAGELGPAPSYTGSDVVVPTDPFWAAGDGDITGAGQDYGAWPIDGLDMSDSGALSSGAKLGLGLAAGALALVVLAS